MLAVNWLEGTGGAFNVVTDNMRRVMGQHDDADIVVSCSGSAATLRGHNKKKKVWFAAINYDELKLGRIEEIERVDYTIGISKFCADTIKKYTDKVSACHLGTNPKQYRPIKNFKFADRPFTFLSTSTDISYGSDIMVEVWSEVIGRLGKHAKVRLLIKDHSKRGLTEKEILDFETMPYTTVHRPTGWKLNEEQLCEVYNQADCLLFPVPSIGSSLFVFECMACEVAPIVGDYSAPAEFVGPKVGYVVPTQIVEAKIPGVYRKPPVKGIPKKKDLIDTIFHVLENKEECREKGINAREKIFESYTWEKVAAEFSEILERNL